VDFLRNIAVEAIAAVLAAGVVAGLAWLFRRRRRERAAQAAAAGPEAQPLRVLVALPRPLLTLLREQGGEWVPATGWDEVGGAHRVLSLRRAWKAEAIERALRDSGAPLAVRFLPHPTEEHLRQALSGRPGYDVLVVDTHGDPDGTLYFEGPCGESHPLPPAGLGQVLVGSGVRLVLLSACYSAAGCRALQRAGVPAVVGMADSVPEDAARAYLETFLARLGCGERLGEAHRRACDALRTRWGARTGEADLPRLFASRWRPSPRFVEPGVPGAYEPLGEAPAPSTLPSLALRLHGRELDQVLAQQYLLARSLPEGISPLAVLAGWGGIGKTSLALAVAQWCWERAIFAGGVRLVQLTDLREGETLADRLLREFNVPPPQVVAGGSKDDEYRARAAALYPLMSGHSSLLVLDNFETVYAPGADGRNLGLVTGLRQHCPGLHVLVTSRRAPLGLTGERVRRLRSLEEDAAVEVFCDRAREVGRSVSGAERATVAEICKLLNHVPLHIRLVASHVWAEPPATILAGLRDARQRYRLTVADLPDEAAHHQSQELSFRYTYDRLGQGGQALWAILAAVFAGTPERAAVRVLVGAEADAALDELLDWQVVEREDGRARMVESVRDFGRQRLAELGLDEGELRARHAAYYLAVAREAFTKDRYQRGEWAAVEERDGADVFAAADWAADELERAEGATVEGLLARWEELGPREADGEQGTVAPAGEWALAMYNYVFRRRPPGGYHWLAAGLVAWRLSGTEEARAEQALLCNEFGLIHDARGEYEAALGWYEKSVALQEALGDRAGLATTYNNIGLIYKARGEYEAALGWYEKSVALKEALGDRAGLATTLHNMGYIAVAQGDLGRARALFTRSRDLYAQIGLDKDVRQEEEMIAQVRRLGGTTAG